MGAYAQNVPILDLFLEAGCEQRSDDLNSAPWCGASPHAKRIYLLHMRKRRQELRELALQYLSKIQIASLGLLSTAFLEANVVAVVERLRAIRVQLPPAFDNLMRDYTHATRGGSIYHHIQDVKDAELAWDLGFRDVSATDADGKTPLCKMRNVPYILWLHKQGVDMFSICCGGPEETTVGITGAHYVASLALPELLSEGLGSDSGNVVADLVPACKEPANLHEVCSSLVDNFPVRVDLGVAKAVTRPITFEAFALPHTCCRFEEGGVKREYTTAEIPELDHIFSEEIQRFEECMVVFFRELETINDSSPINAEIFKEFLHRKWTIIMQKEETLKLNIGTEEQAMEEAAELGVVWQPTLPNEAPDLSSLEYWIGEIDRIIEGKATTYQDYGVV
ncbi:hypothetical protein PG996_015547 [Apiospora saccharicola]|uniref:Uncharacterized protein n=1 Tax=Apiospora saccharicola TaxID=335842 RepID=A0ABR1TLJ5_9PEZI